MDLLINFVPIYEVFRPKERSIFVKCKLNEQNQKNKFNFTEIS